jgi:hypothetical protein
MLHYYIQHYPLHPLHFPWWMNKTTHNNVSILPCPVPSDRALCEYSTDAGVIFCSPLYTWNYICTHKACFLSDFIGDSNICCLPSSTFSFVNTQGLPLWLLLLTHSQRHSQPVLQLYSYVGEENWDTSPEPLPDCLTIPSKTVSQKGWPVMPTVTA